MHGAAGEQLQAPNGAEHAEADDADKVGAASKGDGQEVLQVAELAGTSPGAVAATPAPHKSQDVLTGHSSGELTLSISSCLSYVLCSSIQAPSASRCSLPTAVKF